MDGWLQSVEEFHRSNRNALNALASVRHARCVESVCSGNNERSFHFSLSVSLSLFRSLTLLV